jgi:uncharacterized protein (DUF1684 family)
MKMTKGLSFLLAVQLASATSVGGQTSYEESIRSWRAKQEAELRSESGWLTVVGLFWLKTGVNSVGADPSSDIVLPPGSAPARVGTVRFKDGKAVLHVDKSVTVLHSGVPVTELEMASDATKSPVAVAVGELTMLVIKRGQRYGMRVKHKNSKQRREFTGLSWFPVRESYRITAEFAAYDKPRNIPIANVLGDTNMMLSPGYVTFNLGGRKQRLEPVLEEEKLLFIFRDPTSGKSTYPAGRFLYTEKPKDGKVILDFNQAVNPPCAFTSFATCPLPPRQNRLNVPIAAGALDYHANDKSSGQGIVRQAASLSTLGKGR